MLLGLAILYGTLVGFALGMTGGGGTLLAAPLLIYGLGIAPRAAFGISLAAVGATSLVGVVPRLWSGKIEIVTGVLFAAAGMVGAPLGSWLSGFLPEAVLMATFGLLMLIVAAVMWRNSATRTDADIQAGCAPTDGAETCHRTPGGRLELTSKCALLLAGIGLVTGVLSGLFGVGGGFIIVPALVLFSGMPIHRAIATSLLVIVLISIAGVASHLVAGRDISLLLTLLFAAGGVAGMGLGVKVRESLPAPLLQRVFATGIVAVACLIIGTTIFQGN